jgi:small-conductance mechanosensitive channel
MPPLFGIELPDPWSHIVETVLIAAVTYAAAWIVRRLFLHSVEQLGGKNVIARRISRMLQAIIVVVGLVGIVAVWDIDVSSVIIGLGAVSIAVSFALSTLLNNMVSGVLLMADDSIRVGDTIRVGDLQGRVARIRMRASELETTEGRRIFIPNVYLAQNPVQRIARGPKVD